MSANSLYFTLQTQVSDLVSSLYPYLYPPASFSTAVPDSGKSSFVPSSLHITEVHHHHDRSWFYPFYQVFTLIMPKQPLTREQSQVKNEQKEKKKQEQKESDDEFYSYLGGFMLLGLGLLAGWIGGELYVTSRKISRISSSIKLLKRREENDRPKNVELLASYWKDWNGMYSRNSFKFVLSKVLYLASVAAIGGGWWLKSPRVAQVGKVSFVINSCYTVFIYVLYQKLWKADEEDIMRNFQEELQKSYSS